LGDQLGGGIPDSLAMIPESGQRIVGIGAEVFG